MAHANPHKPGPLGRSSPYFSASGQCSALQVARHQLTASHSSTRETIAISPCVGLQAAAVTVCTCSRCHETIRNNASALALQPRDGHSAGAVADWPGACELRATSAAALPSSPSLRKLLFTQAAARTTAPAEGSHKGLEGVLQVAAHSTRRAEPAVASCHAPCLPAAVLTNL